MRIIGIRVSHHHDGHWSGTIRKERQHEQHQRIGQVGFSVDKGPNTHAKQQHSGQAGHQTFQVKLTPHLPPTLSIVHEPGGATAGVQSRVQVGYGERVNSSYFRQACENDEAGQPRAAAWTTIRGERRKEGDHTRKKDMTQRGHTRMQIHPGFEAQTQATGVVNVSRAIINDYIPCYRYK